MSFSQDLAPILDVVKRIDPSFGSVDPEQIASHAEDAHRYASGTAKDRFLLSAMRLLALSGNGHTCLIPNDAIHVLPLRFVTVGTSVFLTKASTPVAEFAPCKLVAVNGVPVKRIERAAECLLAGTSQRKRVIGPLLFAWPAALVHLGCASSGDKTQYQFETGDGHTAKANVSISDAVPASEFYPSNEHGQVDPVWSPNGFVAIHDYADDGLALTLPSFFDPDERAFPEAIDRAATWVRSRRDGVLVIDVRGNTGGDFLATMPLIDAITESARTNGCAVLVDKFTFSAAIVFVAILRYRLKRKLLIIGEDMGDGLRFFAEGGLIELPASGASIRYSTALHDWENGLADQTTPPEIARQIVAAGKLEVNRTWVTTPFDATPKDVLYRQLINDLA
ncbi:peptidase S41 [uncultured Litoreibacter sp.]|uniref:peptidase S41 n=1 Tax=uncultured Litoreibacter sp. TaxID=1392394 RepID=UPI002607EF9E|nr:peptidase S41 [uncultured Litoreibacter sp.]